jgi:hypothetical protein
MQYTFQDCGSTSAGCRQQCQHLPGTGAKVAGRAVSKAEEQGGEASSGGCEETSSVVCCHLHRQNEFRVSYPRLSWW